MMCCYLGKANAVFIPLTVCCYLGKANAVFIPSTSVSEIYP